MKELNKKLNEKGLKVTPQRIAVWEAIIKLKNHPTAENIIDFIRKNHPNVSVGTVYKVLDTLVENNLIKRVNTEKDIMRYDAITEHHHHIYCSDSEKIEDYNNKELSELIINFFEKNEIPDFKIEDVKLQIIGKYIK